MAKPITKPHKKELTGSAWAWASDPDRVFVSFYSNWICVETNDRDDCSCDCFRVVVVRCDADGMICVVSDHCCRGDAVDGCDWNCVDWSNDGAGHSYCGGGASSSSVVVVPNWNCDDDWNCDVYGVD
jgi:hypothetical protein